MSVRLQRTVFGRHAHKHTDTHVHREITWRMSSAAIAVFLWSVYVFIGGRNRWKHNCFLRRLVNQSAKSVAAYFQCCVIIWSRRTVTIVTNKFCNFSFFVWRFAFYFGIKVKMSSKVESSVTIGSPTVAPVAVTNTRVAPPNSLRRPICVKPRVLMGAGPTNPTQRVTEAMSKPQMGIHSDDVHQVNSMRWWHDRPNERKKVMTAERLTFKRSSQSR